MRAVFIGASSLAVTTAGLLLARGHEVVIIERDMERLEMLSEEIDCGFLHGDGSKPAILREADPGQTDFLFCLTGNDQANIIASLVGRSLGFKRVITKIADPEFEHICIELGLEDTIIPSQTIGRHLADTAQGMSLLNLSGIIRDEARVFAFVAHTEEEGKVSELRLPRHSRVMCLYRNNRFVPVSGDSELKQGDEVVIIAHSSDLPRLHERWTNRLDHGRG